MHTRRPVHESASSIFSSPEEIQIDAADAYLRATAWGAYRRAHAVHLNTRKKREKRSAAVHKVLTVERERDPYLQQQPQNRRAFLHDVQNKKQDPRAILRRHTEVRMRKLLDGIRLAGDRQSTFVVLSIVALALTECIAAVTAGGPLQPRPRCTSFASKH